MICAGSIYGKKYGRVIIQYLQNDIMEEVNYLTKMSACVVGV